MFDRIREDIATFRSHDPAATSTISILLNSPGMRAIWAYRRQHWLWTHGHKLLARTLSTWSRHRFGVEIHPGATIGRRFVIDHGMGIVVGETTIIGDDCQLYQGVTLGGTGKEGGKRHPTLGNNVVVGVGASVLGNITLGDNAKVGGGGRRRARRSGRLHGRRNSRSRHHKGRRARAYRRGRPSHLHFNGGPVYN